MRIALVAIAAVAVWFRVWELFPGVSIIGLAAALIGMYPILYFEFRPSVACRFPGLNLLNLALMRP